MRVVRSEAADAAPRRGESSPGAARFLFSVSDLGEPGAMDTLIALKLSANAQFSDEAGGCTLAERAAKAGDAIAASRLAECRGN